MDGCLLQSEPANACARAVRDWMRANGVAPYDDGGGAVPARVRTPAPDGAPSAASCRAGGFGARTQSLVAALRAACPELTGVVVREQTAAATPCSPGSFYTLWGEAELCDSSAAASSRHRAAGLLPGQPAQAERLYARASSWPCPSLGGMSSSSTAARGR